MKLLRESASITNKITVKKEFLTDKFGISKYRNRNVVNQVKAYRLMPWAWSAAWMVTGVGIAISDLYSSPSKSLIPYVVLSALGWGYASLVTTNATRQDAGIAVRMVAWVVAYLVYVAGGYYWATNWNMGFLESIAAIGVAGIIGGTGSSRRSGVWRLVSGTLVGLAFMVLATISFYASYFLIFAYSSEARLLGEMGANVFIWALPGMIFGLSAGFTARWLLGISRDGQASDPNKK